MTRDPARAAPSSFRLILAMGLLYGAHMACMPLLPLQAARAGWSDTLIGGLVAAYMVSAFVFRAFSRSWLAAGDLRAWYAASGLALAGCALIFALLDPSWLFFLARLLQGLAFAAVTTAAYGWIGYASAPERRGAAFARLGLAMALALVLAPPLALTLENLVPGGGYLFAAGLALAGAVAAPGGGLAIAASAREAPDPQDLLLLGAVIIVTAAIGLMEAFVPLIVQRRALGSVAILVGAYGLFLAAGRFAGGVVSDRAPKSLATAIPLGVVGLAMWRLPLVATPAAALALTAALGAGCGGALSALATRLSSRHSAERQVGVMALMTMCADLGLVAGAVLAGVRWNGAAEGWESASLAIAALAGLLCIGLLFDVDGRRRALRSPEGAEAPQ